jgi:uncharacterized protein with HEPN domain
MKDNLTYIEHIRDAINKIESYIENIDFNAFSKNDMIFDAVVRELEIIGEASNNISEDFQNLYPDIPWHKVVSMRNVLIHEYFGIDSHIVWSTCQNDLITLKTIIEKILATNLITPILP